MSDPLLRRASGRRAAAQWPDDYDVIGADGEIVGGIFKANHLTRREAVGVDSRLRSHDWDADIRIWLDPRRRYTGVVGDPRFWTSRDLYHAV